MMKHQLVFQFDGLDFDTLISVEDALIKGLHSSADVDGHDIGSGQSNIFIFTEDPVGTLHKAREIFHDCGLLSIAFKAASRRVGENHYVILWPPEMSDFQVA